MAEDINPLLTESKRPGIGASIGGGLGGIISGGLGMAIAGGALAAMAAGMATLIPGGSEMLGGVLKSAFPTLAPEAFADAVGAIGYAAAAGAAAFGALGATLGGIAGVVRSREIGRPRIEEIAKVAFAQGVAVGHALEAQEQAAAKESTTFRDMVGKSQKPENFREMVEVQAAQAVSSTKLH